jgi:glucose-1-phosphatase
MDQLKPALILDLGGVIFDIDYKNTIDAFVRLGLPQAEQMYSQAAQSELFDQLEKGLIGEDEFFIHIRNISSEKPTDEQIRHAWNALLIGVPEYNATFLQQLKNNYRLFLLSNTNCIHEKAYRKMISDQYGKFFFDDVFEKMYLSHQVHMRKPDSEIFEFVLQDQQLNPSETLFYDDSIQHVKAATQVGIKAQLFPKGEKMQEVIQIE